ncbi:MAG: tRNA preQ1(34) S-adenosylmethionine ribosyltransferase-isomerase QueA [Planctomycetes bacterium RBG_16_64_10]|nr:MAG: tRNA preQ1(34) S-adenosylmethionine ribosyltransferase-isomerase QueA [Planctomycetes bacterium RBG_16_64_10]
MPAAHVDQYDYALPRALIAQEPLAQRADARMLVVDRRSGTLDHRHVRDLPQLLNRGDRVVLNDSRVLPARLVGYRTRTGGKWQGLFLAAGPGGFWQLLAKARGRIAAGDTVTLLDRMARDDSQLVLIAKQEHGVWVARLEPPEDAHQVLERVGRVPLPHYIRRGEMFEADRKNYQTVFARRPGSIAAPTAGLHFTEELLVDLQRHGIGTVWVTLHVGAGTFRPIRSGPIDRHSMQAEWAELAPAAADTLTACRAAGRRTVAVGTTAVRVLETGALSGTLTPFAGPTDLFIHPPYQFRACDALLTNLHLPRTTLLVLVRTFGGDELVRRAYAEAIRERYRFFSYGDAMLVV